MVEKVKERIIKVLLTEKSLTKYKVSKLANASFGWTHEFLSNLEKLKLVKDSKVINVEGLVDYYFKIKKKPKFREYMIQDPLKVLKSSNLDYAVTTYFAENVVQRFLFPSRLDIYIKVEDFDKWHKMLTSKGLYGKGNFRVLLSSSGLFKSEKFNGLNIVSTPELIVDLKLEGGPCIEAADMLLERLKKDVS